MQFQHWNRFYYSIEQDAPGSPGHGTLTEDEVRAYYTAQSDSGEFPADQIEAKVAKLFEDYAGGQEVISGWPFWGKFNWARHNTEEQLRA